ncbi:MAG: YggT family protein [Pseudomonadota bacterium]
MGSAVQQTLMFIVQFIFGMYSFVIVLRLWLRMADADYNHPFVASIAKSTTPVIRKLQKFLPNVGHFETASLVLLLIVTLVKLILVSFISGYIPHVGGLLAWTLASMIEAILDTAFYLMIMMAILSWIPNAQPMLYGLLIQITTPILMPVRRCVPLLGGMDLSPVVVLIVIQVLEMLMVQPVIRASLSAAFH